MKFEPNDLLSSIDNNNFEWFYYAIAIKADFTNGMKNKDKISAGQSIISFYNIDALISI